MREGFGEVAERLRRAMVHVQRLCAATVGKTVKGAIVVGERSGGHK